MELTVEREAEEPSPATQTQGKLKLGTTRRTPPAAFSLRVGKQTIAGERGKYGAYWFGPVALFLVNQERPGQWDGNPPVDVADWDGGMVDALSLRKDAGQRVALVAALKAAKVKFISPFIVELCMPNSGFSPAEQAGWEWRQSLEAETAAAPQPAEVVVSKEPQEPAQQAPAAKPADSSTMPADVALRELCRAYGIQTLGQLRQLGQAVGLSARDPASGKPDVWGSAVALMRRDSGVTEVEIGNHFEELFGERRVSTTRTNLAAFRLLLAGKGSGEVRIARQHEDGRGVVMRLYGIALSREGILADLAMILSREGGASQEEATRIMCGRYPERGPSIKSTVATQMAMWRSVLSSGEHAAVFSLTDSESGPIYRVRGISDGSV